MCFEVYDAFSNMFSILYFLCCGVRSTDSSVWLGLPGRREKCLMTAGDVSVLTLVFTIVSSLG